MVRKDRSSYGKRPTIERSIRLGSAILAVAAASVFVAARGDDSGPASTRADWDSTSDVHAASIDALLPEMRDGAAANVAASHPGELPRAIAPRAIAKLIGTAAAGLRITLDGSALDRSTALVSMGASPGAANTARRR